MKSARHHSSRTCRVGLNCSCRSVVLLLFLSAACYGADALRPRVPVEKPARVKLDPQRDSTSRIQVKFRDDLPVRLRQGRLEDAGSGVLTPAAPILGHLGGAGAKWQRQHFGLTEEKLSELRANAQKNTGKVMPELNSAYVLDLPPGQDAASVIDALNALDIVEIAWPAPLPAPPPVVPNYEPRQDYLEAAPGGIDAQYAWGGLGGTGVGVQIADIEYDWNLNHADISATLLGPARVVPPVSNPGDHGTAVLGILGAQRNGFGVTGIAYDSTLYAVASYTASGYSVPAAITTALGTLRAGDILVIEQQFDGPAAGMTDYVPVEWDPFVYNAIVTAVGNGIIVCEAAGNGGQNLDDPIFDTGHRPFKPGNDSGAIIVGAGDSAGRSRLGFSCYGYTVDLQGWGDSVVTTGYGDLYSTDGTNLFFTSSFAGTSSATPVVAGACALLQSAYKARHGGQTLSPREMRTLLVATGSPQLDGLQPASEHIGPRPNLRAAKAVVESGLVWLDFYYAGSSEDGTFFQPYNSIPEAAGAVPSGGTILIKPSSSSWTGTINYNKTMTLRAVEGSVTIGR
jgi:serine protease